MFLTILIKDTKFSKLSFPYNNCCCCCND